MRSMVSSPASKSGSAVASSTSSSTMPPSPIRAPRRNRCADRLDRLLAVNVRAPYQLTSGLGRFACRGRARAVHQLGRRQAAISPARRPTRSPRARSIRSPAISPANSASAASGSTRSLPARSRPTWPSDFIGSDEGKEQVKSIQALKRIGQPEDIAGVAGFLAGPDSAWVTGQVIDVSGGTKL